MDSVSLHNKKCTKGTTNVVQKWSKCETKIWPKSDAKSGIKNPPKWGGIKSRQKVVNKAIPKNCTIKCTKVVPNTY